MSGFTVRDGATPRRITEIEVVIDALRIAARKYPQLRIGQLIDNALLWKQGGVIVKPDLFVVRDGVLAGMLLDFDA